MEYHTFDAPKGERLDVAISAAIGASRTFAKELVTGGFVQLDGRPVAKPSIKLSGMEVVSVSVPPPKPVLVEPEEVPLDIIYEDEDLAAINKPPGMTAHPTAHVRSGTVVNALMGKMALAREKLFDPGETDYRPGIVHRLDKDTSGVMVVAKHDEAHRHLALSFKKRLTEKEYVAIVRGDLPDDVHIDAAIGRHPIQGQKMTVGGSSPKSATTFFRVVARVRGYALVKAKPHTGRTHQIRVHLAHLQAGIVGDAQYGSRSNVIARQALHAHRLTLPHPRDNHAITFMAQVAADMVEAWLKLGGSWPPAAGEEEL